MIIIKRMYMSFAEYQFDVVGYVSTEQAAKDYVDAKNKENKEGAEKLAVLQKEYSDWKLLNPIPIVVKKKNNKSNFTEPKVKEDPSEKWLRQHNEKVKSIEERSKDLKDFDVNIVFEYEEIKKLD